MQAKTPVEVAVRLLQEHEPTDGYFATNSGGKDSGVVRHLLQIAGVKHDSHYNVVGADPPELVKFIKQTYPEVQLDIPPRSLWSHIITKGLPLRHRRWCCAVTKERGGSGRTVVTGIRREESNARAKRSQIEPAWGDPTKIFVHPIIDWTEADVWDYIDTNSLPYCSLYEEGFSRLGCVMCPSNNATVTQAQAERWPKMANLWRRAAYRSWERQTKGMQRWVSGEEYYQWWLSREHGSEDGDTQGRLM